VTRQTSSQLETSLKALASELARNLVDAVLRGSLAELVALPAEATAPREVRPVAPASAGRARRGRVAAPKPAAGRAPEAPSHPSLEGASRGQVLEALVSHLRTCPEGARAEELRVALGLTRSRFIQATRDGLSTEEIRKVGQLRSTVYFAV